MRFKVIFSSFHFQVLCERFQFCELVSTQAGIPKDPSPSLSSYFFMTRRSQTSWRETKLTTKNGKTLLCKSIQTQTKKKTQLESLVWARILQGQLSLIQRTILAWLWGVFCRSIRSRPVFYGSNICPWYRSLLYELRIMFTSPGNSTWLPKYQAFPGMWGVKRIKVSFRFLIYRQCHF